MESLVVGSERAKELKAAGFPQKTVNVWERSAGIPAGEYYLVQPELISRYGLWGSQDVKEHVAAPTAQEIADQLPKSDTTEWGRAYPTSPVVSYNNGQWFAFYKSEMTGEHNDDELWNSEGQTIAEALALLWLKLHPGQTSVSGFASTSQRRSSQP